MQRWESRKDHRLAFKSSQPPSEIPCGSRNWTRGRLHGVLRQAASQPRPTLPRQGRSTRHSTATRLRPPSRPHDQTRPRARTGEQPGTPGQVAPSSFTAPHRASTLRLDATTGRPEDAPRPGEEPTPETERDNRRTCDRRLRADDAGAGVSLGHHRSSRARLRARTAGSEKARHESPRDHDGDRPLDVAPGASPSGPALPREQVPVGSAALERQRGNPPGTSASHEGGPVRDARTRKPSWFASAAGTRPREHRRPGNPQPRAGASAPAQSTETPLTRRIRWELQ